MTGTDVLIIACGFVLAAIFEGNKQPTRLVKEKPVDAAKIERVER